MADRNKKNDKILHFFIFLVLIFILDRFLKFLAVNDYFVAPVKIMGNFFNLSFVENYNIAFSLPVEGAILNLVIALIMAGLLYNLIYLLKKRSYKNSFFLAFIVFGAISNLVDRLRFGFVIDYFDLRYFTVFNLADVMIVGGVTGLIYLAIKNDRHRAVF